MPRAKKSFATRRLLPLVIGLCVFLGGLYVGLNKPFPFKPVVAQMKYLRKRLDVARQGEGKYIQVVLDAQLTQGDDVDAAGRNIETADLPLREQVRSMAGRIPIGQGAGDIEIVEDSVLIFDRLGTFFAYSNGQLSKLNYPPLPSGIAHFVADAKDDLNINTLRSHAIAYDRSRNTVYASYEKYDPGTGATYFAISSIRIEAPTLNSRGEWTQVFQSEALPEAESYRGLGGGGAMSISGNRIYFSVGDYNHDGVQLRAKILAQDPKSSFGKIFAYDIPSQTTRMISMGHRNPEGLFVTRQGALIEAEHGPQGGDELNLIVDGGNYGWPYATYGTDYGSYAWPLKQSPSNPRFVEPVFAWVPSAGVSALIQVDKFHTSWDGDLLVGSLKAQSIFRLKYKADRVIFSEPIWIGHRIRSIRQWRDKIVLWTDDSLLLFLTVDADQLEKHIKSTGMYDPKLDVCLNCHHFGPTNSSHSAPSLSNIVGRPIAGDNFPHYSTSLTKKTGRWNEEMLFQFIRNPQQFSSGSAMPRPNIDDEQIKEIIDILADTRS